MTESLSSTAWRGIFAEVLQGAECAPRGLKILEVENACIPMPRNLFMGFDNRKLNLDYIRREFQWYLAADPKDLRICDHAKIWKDHVNDDGTLSSNYGYYLFARGGLVKVVNELIKDPDSRRAATSIFHSHDHLGQGRRDIPCTYALSFRIRRGELNMTVMMRSNDLWFGLGNDAPIFGFIHQMAWRLLQDVYPDLQLGMYMHYADSLHLYEKDWEKAAAIASGEAAWTEHEIPMIASAAEVSSLVLNLGTAITNRGPFTSWLHGVAL